MFYVQNWDSVHPNYSAYQILQQQLVSIKKSLQYFDASTKVRKDSYLKAEIAKIRKLVYIIQDNLRTLRINPKDTEAANFLFNGNVSLQTGLEKGLAIFEHLEKAVDFRIQNVDDSFDQVKDKVSDPRFKSLLEQVKHFDLDDESLNGSRCGITAFKIVDFFSDYIRPEELEDVKSLKNLQKLQGQNTQILDTFFKGADKLKEQISQDLRNNEHKLYFCVIENQPFKESGSWGSSNYEGHAFVIEKSADDRFRLYQSYANQYSLKSHLVSELTKNPEGFQSFESFFPFLKNLTVLGVAKKWDNAVNEAYKNCFSVDHKAFLGEDISDEFFNLRFSSMTVLDEKYKDNDSEGLDHTFSPVDFIENLNLCTKNVALGSSLGIISASALFTSVFAVSKLFQFLGLAH